MGKALTHLDLFSGIGGFALGLESTGHFETVAFCEIEEFPRRVLAKHWPRVRCYEDIRGVTAARLVHEGIEPVAIITGGFPCQDVSLAGRRTGLAGARSGLWSELFRVISEVRPRWVIVENVLGLRTKGADRVLDDLARADYAAWPMVVGAVHAGAPHRRQRVWIVAHAQHGGGRRLESERGPEQRDTKLARDGKERIVAHATGLQSRRQQPAWDDAARQDGEMGRPEWANAPNAQGIGRPTQGERGRQEEFWAGPDGKGWDAADAQRQRPQGRSRERLPGERRAPVELAGGSEQWSWDGAPEPVLRRVDARLPCGMDRRKRLKALGNAVVPQIVATLGKAIWHVEENGGVDDEW